jgi:hypothetical protein
MREGLGRLRISSSLKLSATGMPHRDGVLQIQALLHAAAARTIDELWEAIRLALGAFTPSECQNYFAAAGYNAT